MKCYRPILVRNPRYNQLIVDSMFISDYTNLSTESSLHRDRIDSELDLISPYHYVPCRKCPACLKARSYEWQGRLSREFEYYTALGRRSLFVTLTYDEFYIKNARDTYKRDLAIFFDRLRSKFRRNIRHFCISELGDKKGRFHIHCILFDVPTCLGPNSHFHRSKNGALMGSNDIVMERWQKGIVDVGFLKEASGCAYVAKYLTKDAPNSPDEVFVSPIVSSNGIGFQDVSVSEVSRVLSAIRSGSTPYYEVGPFRYSYPQSFTRKYTDFIDRYHLSYTAGLQSVARGGFFEFGDFRTYDYFEFKNYLSRALHGVYMYRTYSDLCSIEPDKDFLRFYQYNDYLTPF